MHEVRWTTVRDGLFLIGLLAVFVLQVVEGAEVVAHPGDAGSVNTIAALVRSHGQGTGEPEAEQS